MMNRSALNGIRSSIGMGQGNIRNTATRSKDMKAQSTASNQVSWDNPGLPQQAPVSTLPMGFSGSQPAVPPTPSPGPLSQGGSFFSPQFQSGAQQRGAYGQQLNRFLGAGGNFNQFKPRMGAVGPAYRNGMSARPFVPPAPPKPGYGGDDGNIDPPPPNLSFVQPSFGGGF